MNLRLHNRTFLFKIRTRIQKLNNLLKQILMLIQKYIIQILVNKILMNIMLIHNNNNINMNRRYLIN